MNRIRKRSYRCRLACRRVVLLFCVIACAFLPDVSDAQVNSANCIPPHQHWSLEQYLEAASQQNLELKPGDEVWWVSSRDVVGQLDSLDKLTCIRLDDDNHAKSSISAQDFVEDHNSRTNLTTVVYVHGNRTDPCWSMKRGIQVYSSIFGRCEERGPVRFVIWHWPAEQCSFPVQEYEDNSVRAIIHGRHFARFCMCLDPQKPIRFAGYSLGSQFLLSAAEQIGNFAERNCGNAVEWQTADIRMVTLAPVIACSWPSNDQQVTRIASVIDKVLVFENGNDIALRLFKFKCQLENPGCFCGSNVYDPIEKKGTSANHVDIGDLVGRKHSIANYVEPALVRELVNDHFLMR